jgi:acyl dehydratase
LETRRLDSPPSLTPLYGRAALGVLPGGGGDDLPEFELELEGLEVDPRHLAEYCRVCGFTLRETLPPTYPHVLAFPLAMSLMTAREFPFALMGLVHVANRIEQVAPISLHTPLTLRVRAENLRDHPRGRQLDMVAEAENDGEILWRSWNTYLKRGGGSGERREQSPADPLAGAPVAALWKVPGDIGRRYAGVSGDRNPIHLHGLAAKPFGFPGAIAHGMWMKARCLAFFDGHLPEAHVSEVDFRAPLRIPGRARLLERLLGPDGDPGGRGSGGRAFGLESPDGERRHLNGRVTPR